MTATTWAHLLDAFEKSIDEAVATTDGDRATGDDPVWTPPAEPPSELPTADELARFRALRARQESAARKLRSAMHRNRQDATESARRRHAARAYHS